MNISILICNFAAHNELKQIKNNENKELMDVDQWSSCHPDLQRHDDTDIV